MKAGKSQGPNGRVDLFKNLSQRNEIAALLYGGWVRPAREFFGEGASFMLVVVLQAHERHRRGPDGGVIRPGHAVQAGLIDPRPRYSEPDGGDLRLHVSVVPGKAWGLSNAGGCRGSAGAASRPAGDKVVRVGGKGEAWGPERVEGPAVAGPGLGRVGH